MTHEINEAAAAAILEGERAVANLAELHGRLKPCFARAQPFAQAKKYMSGLMGDLPRKNGWTIAEHAGDLSPNWTRRLLNHAVWDQDAAMALKKVSAHDPPGYPKPGFRGRGSLPTRL